jgi:transcriptional regulator with XRE-family HTH domain
LRKEKNLSQEELSFKADLHRTYIGMIERAEKNITLVNIEKIAKALNVDIKELFDDTV